MKAAEAWTETLKAHPREPIGMCQRQAGPGPSRIGKTEAA